MTAVAPAAERTWRLLSQTAGYALRAVLHLAVHATERPLGAAALAASLGVPERYLARVLNTLAHEGVLVSTRGTLGGYRLARCATGLSLATVVAPFDDVGEAPQCLLREQRCGLGQPCQAHGGWSGVAGNVSHFFQQTTIADLIAHGDLPIPGSDPEGARRVLE